MNHKEELKDLLAHRSGMIVNDCRTFLAAKSQSKKTHDLVKKGQIGGGNLLCAMGLFAVLNLLSKAFVLTKDFDHYIDVTKTSVRKGGVNETDAFAEFIEYLQSNDIQLGLPTTKQENKEIWSRIRDELNHLAWPMYAISSINMSDAEGMDLATLEKVQRDFGPPFYEATLPDGTKEAIFSVDRLYILMEDIMNQLSAHIDSAEEKNVKKTLHWVNGV